MQQILTTFGVDWHLLLINAVNFGLLMLVLWYFLYGPVLRMLEERRTKVSQGVKDAEEATKKLSEIERSRSSVLAAAGKEADSVISAARAAGGAKERELLTKGEAAAAVLLKEAEAQAAELKLRSLEESKQEVAKLIVLGMEKIHATKAQGK
jgi:F-type H+-transporting ATPase subunit b